MKKLDLGKLKQNALSTVKAFPVEIILSICLFVFVVFQEEAYWDLEKTKYFLAYIPLFWILSFCLNQLFAKGIKRLVYFLSVVFIAFIPLITIEPYKLTYCIIWLIALTALLACRRQKNNFYFTIDSLRIPFHIALSGLLSLSLALLVWGIYASLIYIFDIQAYYKSNMVLYIFMFPLCIIAPFLFCLYQQLDQNKYGWKANKFLNILCNWILSPALIAYTSLLYIYGVKILIAWDLPKGLLSIMISAFLFIAIITRALQELLPKKYFDWYYGRFDLIAIPVLVLFWTGIIYRINEYGFTEDRILLCIAAILLSVFTLAPVVSGKTRYIHLLYLVIILLAPVTFIPPISAKKLGLISQESRLNKAINALDLRDPETGLIRKINIPESIYADSSEKLYLTMTEAFRYIRNETSPDYMENRFGYPTVESLREGLFAENLPEYIKSGIYSNHVYHYNFNNYARSISEYNELVMFYLATKIRNDSVFISKDSLEIVAFDISNFLSERPTLLNDKADQNEVDSLLYLKNDSCLVSIGHIMINEGKLENISISYLLKK